MGSQKTTIHNNYSAILFLFLTPNDPLSSIQVGLGPSDLAQHFLTSSLSSNSSTKILTQTTFMRQWHFLLINANNHTHQPLLGLSVSVNGRKGGCLWN